MGKRFLGGWIIDQEPNDSEESVDSCLTGVRMILISKLLDGPGGLAVDSTMGVYGDVFHTLSSIGILDQ